MTYAIVGSRDIFDYELVERELDRYDDITTIVSGAANGIDSLARKYAERNNIPMIEFPADWNKHGKKAGFLRNVDIVENADTVIAFQKNNSKGTRHSIDIAKRKNKPVMAIQVT